jgi:diadenosine tetraphosphatase ApaH/serine/threonine PP2A family protein phosphatase
MCFGHTHKPYYKVLPTELEGNIQYRHAINIGSVGKPKDGNSKGCYVLLTVNADSSVKNKDAVQVDFMRFEYDVERAAKAIEGSPLPNEYAEMLRRGF